MPQKSSETMPGERCGQRAVVTQLRAALTSHAHAIAEEVARVGDQRDEAALQLRIGAQARVLEHQTAAQPKADAERHAEGEDEEEEPEAVEER